MPALYIGLISGTSVDAVDAVIVDLSSDTPKLLQHHSEPVQDALRQSLLNLIPEGNNELRRYAELDVAVAQLFSAAVSTLLSKARLDRHDIIATGSHGQTLRHYPDIPTSLQIGDPALIAENTGITTVADFRRRDMAAGGQGAPLVPAFHEKIFRDEKHDRVIVNIGGIANITLLPADQKKATSGFDTGPGNGLMDNWIASQQNLLFDKDGDWARSGQVNDALLKHFLADPYFSQTPPKSTGREYFNPNWLDSRLVSAPDVKAEDIQASLCELTVQSISQAICINASPGTQVLVCGGGVHNRYLMERLAQHMPEFTIHSTAEFGVDPDWVEAMTFAWLAKQTLEGKPGNLPIVTGARHACVLGGIYPAG